MKTRIFLLLGACLIIAGVAMAAELPSLKWYVIGGGGGPMVNGKTEINGTLGQPVVGLVSEGKYSLYAGYWAGVEDVYLPADEYIFLPLIRR